MKKLSLLIRLSAMAICAISALFTAVEILHRKPAGPAGCLFEALAGAAFSREALATVECGLILLFGVLFWLATQTLATQTTDAFRPNGVAVALMALQAILAASASTELLLLVAIEAALILPLRLAMPWVVAQSLMQAGSVYWQVRLTGTHPLLSLFAPEPRFAATAMLLMAVTSQVWHFLSLGLGLFAASAVRQASELRRVVAELKATEQLEASTARMAERLSISRELHDSAGHHLTALTLNLRLMRHSPYAPEMPERIEECLFVVQQLLTEVRGVVRDLRSVPTIDVREAIRTMIEGMPGVNVHLTIGDRLATAPPLQAHALFRSVQEILTNTVKHAGARNLWLEIDATNRGIQLAARDDGRGAVKLVFGNGLRGIEERMAEMGGSLEVRSRSGEGFHVTLSLPLREHRQ